MAIAAVSTRELVTKDLAVEPDENKMRKAAHWMAQNLAGSLAMVTCKEPLRMSMVTNLRAIFMSNGLTDVCGYFHVYNSFTDTYILYLGHGRASSLVDSV